MNIAAIVSETNPLDREAIALANVQRMRDDLIAVREENAQLRADLHRAEDRVVMLLEQSDRHRHGELRLRKLLNELTTQMSNISLLARKAEDYVREVDDMDEQPTPPTEALDKLESEFVKGNADCHITTPNEGRG